MANPLSPMARTASPEKDASMSKLGALHTMKFVGPAFHHKALRHVSGRLRNRGFSLMELMIALVVIGILMSISMPAYREYMIRANQAAAKAVLMDVSSRQEQYLVKAGRFTCSNPATVPPDSDSDQAPTCTHLVSSDGALALLRYTIPTEVIQNFDITLTAGTLPATYSVVAMRGLPTFRVSASGKAGTIQAGSPAAGATTEYSINQFGLKLPVSAW